LPKYRYPILTGKVALRVRELVRQIAGANEVEIISGVVSSDHIHIYVSILPSLSISKFVQFVKGATSRKIQLEFEDIRKRYWGQHVWARGYFVATVGNVTDEMIREYIGKHANNEKDDDEFRILNP
jgi:putative transposase